MKKVLKNTALEGLEGSFIKAEKEYGVNAIFLLAIVIEESGWGTSYLAKNNNNICGIKNGSNWRYFSNKEECIDYQANLLRNKYLTVGGIYYNGVSVKDVNKLYCEGNEWSNNIISIAKEIVNKINKKA
ncbi:MAG: glucosaminidase domain-containing protein [Clostridium sp.]|uniref:glucosaminidase domain-containing protein n=1 Tax=Clostridium sp. TaxID=1506 RepID=UPI0025BABC7C|nr:glucosaminidase domain-containing protein [Clostridium sp.]MCI9069951.1 glucosaminidase domain-containing protein [Clostridium sp.]MCI9304041.1 glucosaminidase domain-containing protein [Clostridium sp.]